MNHPEQSLQSSTEVIPAICATSHVQSSNSRISHPHHREKSIAESLRKAGAMLGWVFLIPVLSQTTSSFRNICFFPMCSLILQQIKSAELDCLAAAVSQEGCCSLPLMAPGTIKKCWPHSAVHLSWIEKPKSCLLRRSHFAIPAVYWANHESQD